jgi:hypothetical protein
MNPNTNPGDDDLALFAMHLLEEPDATAVARHLAKSEEARRQLAEVRLALAAYAEATTELQAVPQGSLDRLMTRIEREQKISPMAPPRKSPAISRQSISTRKLLPWIGWTVAAAMSLMAGKLYRDRAGLHQVLSRQTGQVAHLSADELEAYRERDVLKAALSKQQDELAVLRAQSANEKRGAGTLQAKIASQGAALNEQQAKLSAQGAVAADATRDRDSLQQTISVQANQLAELRAEERRAQEVLEALTDRTALHVTLTKPKTKAAPTARATYLASRGTLIFLASNLAQLSSDKVYQVWLMPADRSKPVPAGTFAPDARGNASVVYMHFPRAVAARGFGVTVEKVGGSQTPTLPIVLAGE